MLNIGARLTTTIYETWWKCGLLNALNSLRSIKGTLEIIYAILLIVTK